MFFFLLLTGCQNSQTNQATVAATQTDLVSGINLSYIDKTVRPQDNFYLYVNGGWLKDAQIPADKTAIGAFYDLRDNADDDVKAIIEDLASRQHLIPGSDEQKVGDLFRSYMDQETRERLGLSPIQPLLDEVNQLTNKTQLIEFLVKPSQRHHQPHVCLY